MRFKKTEGNIIYTDYTPSANHPCPFPIDLVQYFTNKYGFGPNKTVLEPFMGSGRLGREVVREGGTY
ncbi:hypothetical protein KC872_03440, partial [Candidatus Kaiserbacteria bacterium]|nr:hypothetical protein [Candidatus Kaiserbacteria bacterium]